MRKPDVACVVAAGDALGECPVWSAADGRLYWTDISAPALKWYGPATGESGARPLLKPLGAFVLRAGGGMLAAFRAGLAYLDPATGTVDWHAEAVSLGDTRFNDGKCDAEGRFWVGTLDRQLREGRAALYRVDPGLKCRRMDGPFNLCNGIAWSPDNRTMYLTDTRAYAIYAYDFDLTHGEIANRRVFVSFAGARGRPDGCAIDAEGFLWSAEVHGWCLNRFDPSGQLERKVELPIERPTSCAFGGPDFATLYVTTSSMGLRPEALAGQPLAGGLLALDPGVKGLPEPRFAG